MTKKIEIPHLGYTVYVRQFVAAPDEKPNALSFVRSLDRHSCAIYLKKGKQNPGDLAHELIHVLQFIAANRDIDFAQELEHFGYMMHYMMGQILGYEYSK